MSCVFRHDQAYYCVFEIFCLGEGKTLFVLCVCVSRENEYFLISQTHCMYVYDYQRKFSHLKTRVSILEKKFYYFPLKLL